MMSTDYQKSFRTLAFNEFIGDLKQTLHEVFEVYNHDEAGFHARRFPQDMLKKIMDHVPLSVGIPSEYGGRGAKPKECMSLLQAASYESIPLTLIFGINIALFCEPFGKYGQKSIKQQIFDKFLMEQHMGGLMITEPEHGSDALNMKTAYNQTENGHYHLAGIKHWQGLTGMADYWLVAARKKTSSGALGRDVDLFVTEDHVTDQHINVRELYKNNGLYPIPYGLNQIDINIPETHRLIPETTGIKMLMDILHRSRLQFPGMAIGFIKRTLDDATRHCNERIIRGNPLLQFDQVKAMLTELETSFTICSAMCFRSSSSTSIDHDLALSGIEANTFKAVVSDLMQQSAQIYMQLLGGKGYRIKSMGSRAIMDSRPFQIFEGPNDMLFTQLAEMMMKMMKKSKENNLLVFMKNYDLSKNAAKCFAKDINIILEKGIPQRKLVILGQAMAKVILGDHLMSMANNGFNPSMITNCMDRLRRDVSNLINNYNEQSSICPSEGYNESSSWLDIL